MRSVVDTNVLVSAALAPSSVPARAYDLARILGAILESSATLNELDRVLHRPRLDKFCSLQRRERLLEDVTANSELIEIAESIVACRDPKDDKFLELAVSGHATHSITGDLDLLALHPFRGVAILTPTDFVALFDPPVAA